MCKQNMTNTSTKLKCWSHACDSSPYGLLFFPFLWIFTSVVITISASELHSSDSCVKWIPFLRFVFSFLFWTHSLRWWEQKKSQKTLRIFAPPFRCSSPNICDGYCFYLYLIWRFRFNWCDTMSIARWMGMDIGHTVKNVILFELFFYNWFKFVWHARCF